MREYLVGYEFLRSSLGLSAFACALPARVSSVAKITIQEDRLAVPLSVAPQTNLPLAHVLFAIKHEGVNLQILAQSLQRVTSDEMVAAVLESPGGKYVRIAAFLWERFNGVTLEGLPEVVGPYAALFDEDKYIVGPAQRNSRWRVDCNGLGPIGINGYCPMIEKTLAIQSLLALDTLERAKSFASSLDSDLLDRTLAWSYLSETQSSFAIERETPSHSKAEAFAQLLRHASYPEVMTEEYLVQLQNLSMTNPLQHDFQFRNRVNWLHNGGSGALGVTYVPPPPDFIPSMMDALMQMINQPPASVNPLVTGALASFAFVLAHPFMDGNGRLSRFLFHKVVASAQGLDGMVLPISIAMQRNEKEYLAALKSFSAPARKLWRVMMIDEGQYDLQFNGDDAIYRYWDATACVEFGLRMAEQALEIDLKEETRFLQKFDLAYKRVSQAIDVNNNTLSLIIRLCLKNEGSLSKTKQKLFLGKGISQSTISRIEECCTRICNGFDNGEYDDSSAVDYFLTPKN